MVAALAAIADYLGVFSLIGVAAYTAWHLLSERQKEWLIAKATNGVRGSLLGAARLLGDVESQLSPIVKAFVHAFEEYGGPLAKEMKQPVEDLTRNVFNGAAAAMVEGGLSTPENALRQAAEAMAVAFGFGVSSAGVTAAFEAAFPEKLNTFNAAGPILAQMAGFEEIASAARRPLYENAFGKSLEYHFRSTFKPEYPDEGDAVEWHSRGLLTDEQLRAIFEVSGLKTEYEDAYVKSAYRPISAFIMLEVLRSGSIDLRVVKDALAFNGYRPQDITALLDYANWAAVQPYMEKFLSAVLTAAERGTLTDQEVEHALENMHAPADAATWTLAAIHTRKLEQLAELYRKSISEAYKYGLIADAEYVPHLEAIGIAEADANAHYAIDSMMKKGKAEAAAEKEAAHKQAREQAAAVRSLLAQFRAGTINEEELGAELIATGIDPAVAGFAVSMAVARRQGSMRVVDGKLVSRDEAQVLKAQVDAIKEQMIKHLIDDQLANQELEGLGIPEANRIALVSRWAAQAELTVLPFKP